ncbi:MAG: hypothetical protein ACK55I_42665, partial [bacterium]
PRHVGLRPGQRHGHDHGVGRPSGSREQRGAGQRLRRGCPVRRRGQRRDPVRGQRHGSARRRHRDRA